MTKKKVLIVEDTKTITSLVETYLLLTGWKLEFVEANNGAEGLQKAKETKPDLIISDVQMPGMDGFALCAAIRSDAELSEVPILLVSSQKDEVSRQKGKLVGASGFLPKPIPVNDLREKVGELLKLRGTEG